jgi:hypothetical protein
MAITMPAEKLANDRLTSMESPGHNEERPSMDLYEEVSFDPVYQAKARVLNRIIQEIGMGRYQVQTHNLISRSIRSH